MIITNSVNLSLGISASNVYFNMVPYTNKMESTGLVPCDLRFWLSEADYDSGKEGVWPIDVHGSKITTFTMQFVPGEIIKSGPNCTVEDLFTYFKTKLSAGLSTKYGWTITP